MPVESLQGKTAIVTGASSGIGAAIARDLAARGCNLVLVARREERLRVLQAELEGAYPVKAQVLPLDLTAPGAVESLHRQTEGSGLAVDILVNNAGFAIFGDYPEIDWERERELYELDLVALAHLTRLFLKGMLARKQGYLMLVASVMGLMPVPAYTSYSAAKAFVVSYGRALGYELRNTGVGVTVVAPGATESEFLQVAGQPPSLAERVLMMNAQDVARRSVRALLKRQPIAVIGKRNLLAVAFIRLLPESWAIWMTHTLMIFGSK